MNQRTVGGRGRNRPDAARPFKFARRERRDPKNRSDGEAARAADFLVHCREFGSPNCRSVGALADAHATTACKEAKYRERRRKRGRCIVRGERNAAGSAAGPLWYEFLLFLFVISTVYSCALPSATFLRSCAFFSFFFFSSFSCFSFWKKNCDRDGFIIFCVK